MKFVHITVKPLTSLVLHVSTVYPLILQDSESTQKVHQHEFQLHIQQGFKTQEFFPAYNKTVDTNHNIYYNLVKIQRLSRL
jgi:hypothetical protein